jgi:hypothetical protein
MGFLDHSTSNIIVDAVLTDVGRQFLARNDGSFSIVKFSLADDEVDYAAIKKYGRIVGKEKIEKNTPVFEAQTSSDVALKYKCISLSNPNLVRLPNFTLTGEGVQNNTVSMTTRTDTVRTMTFTQGIVGENTIDAELRDQQFLVKIPNQFLQIVNVAPDFIDKNGVAYYTLIRNPVTTAAGGSTITFTLGLKSITDVQFAIFGTSLDKAVIKASASITGIQSGVVNQFVVNIAK